jgi:gluconate 2-dehydrogenase alpha chain
MDACNGIMATQLKPVDVAVVGLGAAGGVAVLPLARAGLTVAGIEAGTWMSAKDYRADEIHNNVRRRVTSVPKAQREIPTIRANPGETAVQAAQHPMMNAVGGTSIHYWAQSWRLKPWDFRARSETLRRYGAGALPQGSTLEDWPLTYDEIEPYYDRVEWELDVSGKAGNLAGKIDPRGNIFEGPRRREYPMPPLRSTEFIDHMAEAARRLGWHPFHPPAAINTEPRDHRPGCAYHGFCNAGGCHVSAKSSTAVTTIPAAAKTKHLTIFDLAHVTRIASDAKGRVTGVTYLRNGEEFFQPCKVVLLAGYTYENSRLLLLSKSGAYSNGLANNHGQVGRHFFAHYQTGAVTALFPFEVNIWYGLPAQGIAVDDFADDAYDHSGVGFIGGTSMHVRTERHAIEAAAMDTYGKAPGWGSAWKKFVHENAARVANSYLQTSTFPYESCFLDLDPMVKDPLGDPVCRITTGGVKQNEDRAIRYAQKKMEQWFREAGAIATEAADPGVPALTTHAYGGTRMGDNPETSVTDRWGFSHEAPNLGILGASVMGTSGARNPTLTAQALAWRTAEHLVKNWKTIAE